MARKPVLLLFLLMLVLQHSKAQVYFKTSDLFKRPATDEKAGSLNIIQPPAIDTLISRYVLANRKLDGGLEGFRIQIFRSANRNAKEESSKERARFMIEFPDIPSYEKFAEPAYFLVKVGDYRTKLDCTKDLTLIRKKFPNAYPVPDIINFPDLNKK